MRIAYKVMIGLAAFVCAFPAVEAQAQFRALGRQTQAQTASYSQNAPVSVVQTSAVAVQSAPVSQSGCSCGCGSSSGCSSSPAGGCKLVVTPGSIQGNVTRTKIDWTKPVEDCDCIEETIKFYDLDVPVDGTIQVPQKKKKCVETITFERKSFNVCGCTVSVCVPCETICTESSTCEPVDLLTKIAFRPRTQKVNGATVYDAWVYDAWVYGVKGLPSPAILGVELTAAAAKAQFKLTQDLP